MAAAQPTNKRKRGDQEQQDLVRQAPSFQGAGSADMDTYSGVDGSAISQLLAHNNGQHNGGSADHGLDYKSHADQTQSASAQAAQAALQYDIGQSSGEQLPYPSHPPPGVGDSFLTSEGFAMDPTQQPGNQPGQSGSKSPSQGTHKPSVGSEEWHKVRRDNHKEGMFLSKGQFAMVLTIFVVERRRRETINEGITELSRIVPGCEKNKGSILQRAVQYIQQLKDNEETNLEKWTLEKMLTDQAIQELSSHVERADQTNKRATAELEAWKQAALKAGVREEDVEIDESTIQADQHTVDHLQIPGDDVGVADSGVAEGAMGNETSTQGHEA